MCVHMCVFVVRVFVVPVYMCVCACARFRFPLLSLACLLSCSPPSKLLNILWPGGCDMSCGGQGEEGPGSVRVLY